MKKKYFYSLLIFMSILMFFLTSQNTFAANISNFSVNVATGGDYYWRTGLSWGQSFDANYIRRIEPHFTYSGTPSGNYGALSSTFNLVNKYCFSDGQTTRLINPNTIVLEQIAVNGAMATIEEKSVTYSITDWTTSENINNIQTTCHNRTFTFYVSATFTNFSAGSNPSIWFTIGSDTAFLFTPDYSSNYNYFYFEDDSNNQTNVAFDNNVNNALLQTQVNQNQQIINQNQQVIEQDQQDRDDIESASDSGQENSDASQEQNEQATSTLLSVIGSFIQALGAPASNCQVRTDLGNIDLGTLDFCTGKPNELTPIINTVCAMVMCIPIYLIARDLFRRFVYITTFAQGGEYK